MIGHESRSSLDRPTLCPEDVERLVFSGVSIEEYRFQGKMWPVDIFSSHYRSTRSNYRETACKRGERKSLFAFTDESAFENAIDLSNRYPLSIRPERKVSTSSSRFKSEQINGRFRFRLELDFRLWTKFHSLRASSTHTHTYIYILTRIARCIDIAYLIDDIPSIRSFRLSDHEHC